MTGIAAVVVLSGCAGTQMPPDAGKYRLVLPPRFEGGTLDTTSPEAASLGPVQATGIQRFPHWVPVVAIYKQRNRDASGSWINITGAYGDVANPSAELSTVWQDINLVETSARPEDEPAGPHGTYLQCEETLAPSPSGFEPLCLWADDSSVVEVGAEAPFTVTESGVTFQVPASPITTVSELAAVTRALMAQAEVLRQ